MARIAGIQNLANLRLRAAISLQEQSHSPLAAYFSRYNPWSNCNSARCLALLQIDQKPGLKGLLAGDRVRNVYAVALGSCGHSGGCRHLVGLCEGRFSRSYPMSYPRRKTMLSYVTHA